MSSPETAFFDQPEYARWYQQAGLGWPQNGQWCPRHWTPGAFGYNGIGASVAMMEEFASGELSGSATTPAELNVAMRTVVGEHGAICCALGDKEMYRIWQDWPESNRLPGQIYPEET